MTRRMVTPGRMPRATGAGWLVMLLLSAAASPAAAQHERHSPYAGAGSEEVKTLTPEEVTALLEGEGMGLARPAELNGYPGPRHVLDLADSLALTDDQAARTSRVFAEMSAEAKSLGRDIVDRETELDALFARGAPASAIEGAVRTIARLEGELRLVHLKAHLAVTAILTEHQRHEYARLRGYGTAH